LEIFSVCIGSFKKSSVCLSCFNTGQKHRNKLKQTKKNVLVSRKKTKNTQNRLSFGLF
jgi:hypothetical protein